MDEVTVMVPVATVQVGWVILTDGAEGATGCAFTVTEVADDVQPELFLAVTLYVPGDRAEKTPVVFVYVEPLVLKLNPVMDEVTVMVPVETEQVGCVIEIDGAAGFVFMVKFVAARHPTFVGHSA
jgi:hypothetical protein